MTNILGGPDLMIAIEDNRAAVEALGELLVTTLERGDSALTHLGMGVHVLFRWIAKDAQANMEMARDMMREQRQFHAQPQAATNAFKLDPDHPDYQAMIASNAEILAEMKAHRADLDAMRQEVIAELQDADASDIAQVVDLEEEQVKRVIAQLSAATTAPAPEAGKVKRVRGAAS